MASRDVKFKFVGFGSMLVGGKTARRLSLRILSALSFGILILELSLWMWHTKVAVTLNQRFESSDNDTSLPDYRVNGLLVHTNDGWADVHIHDQSRQMGFVSLSYIRRDVSSRHKKPIFFSKDYRDIPWMPNDLIGSGVILDNSSEFTPLCFYVTDSASANRNYYGCGGKIAAANPESPFDFPGHFSRYGFEEIPRLLDYERRLVPPFAEVYVPGFGIETCSLYGIRDSFDYDRKLLASWHTTCSFAIDKRTFSVALGFSKKYIRDYNEFLVREWSQGPNPVAAVFYVTSSTGQAIEEADSTYFRKVAEKIRWNHFTDSGSWLPILQFDLDAFSSDQIDLLRLRPTDASFSRSLFSRVWGS